MPEIDGTPSDTHQFKTIPSSLNLLPIVRASTKPFRSSALLHAP